MKQTTSPAKDRRWLRKPADQVARESIFVPICGKDSLQRDKNEVYREIRQKVRAAFHHVSICDATLERRDLLVCPSIDDGYEQDPLHQCQAARICPFCFSRRVRATFISTCQAAATLPLDHMVVSFYRGRSFTRKDGGDLTKENREAAIGHFCQSIGATGRGSLAARDLKPNGCSGAAVDHHISLDRPDRITLHRFGVALVDPAQAENWQEWKDGELEYPSEIRRVGKPRDLFQENLAQAILKEWKYLAGFLKAKPSDLQYYLASTVRFHRTYGRIKKNQAKVIHDATLRDLKIVHEQFVNGLIKIGNVRETKSGRYVVADVPR